MSTFESVCIILNNIYEQIRTKRNLTDPELLNERIIYENCENIVQDALSSFISGYADSKVGDE